MRRVLIALSVCAIALLVAACGGGGSSSSSSDATSSTEGSGDVSGKISIWDFEYESFPEYTEGVKKLDAEFEKINPGVTIERIAQPYEGYEALVRTAFISHEVPDIMLMQAGQALEFEDGLEDLSSRVTPEMQEKITQWESVNARIPG